MYVDIMRVKMRGLFYTRGGWNEMERPAIHFTDGNTAPVILKVASTGMGYSMIC